MELDLPRAQIRRIIQTKLPSGVDDKNFAVGKDAQLAFAESAKVFISYISTTANDICKEGKRQTISAEDVIKAVEELEFTDIAPQLKEYLESEFQLGADSMLSKGDPPHVPCSMPCLRP
jgi:DNA polymerase epsilon subunit 3